MIQLALLNPQARSTSRRRRLLQAMKAIYDPMTHTWHVNACLARYHVEHGLAPYGLRVVPDPSPPPTLPPQTSMLAQCPECRHYFYKKTRKQMHCARACAHRAAGRRMAAYWAAKKQVAFDEKEP